MVQLSRNVAMRLLSFTRSSAASRISVTPLGERGRDREHRQLVDDRLLAVNGGAVERRVLDREVGHRLAAAVGLRCDRDRCAHLAQHVEVGEAARVREDVLDHEVRAGHERGRDHEERGRRRVAGDVERERRRRARVGRGS